MNEELARVIDSVSKDKGIDKEIILEAVNESVVSAAHKLLKTDPSYKDLECQFNEYNDIELFEFKKGADFQNYASISITGMIIGLFTTMPAQPPIMVAMASVLAEGTGWSQMSVIMTAITAWGVFPFFYQAPPVVVAVTLGNLRISDVTKMLVLYMIVGVLLKLPLHFIWGQYVGMFTAIN